MCFLLETNWVNGWIMSQFPEKVFHSVPRARHVLDVIQSNCKLLNYADTGLFKQMCVNFSTNTVILHLRLLAMH